MAAAMGAALGVMAVRYSKLEGPSPERELDALRLEFEGLIQKDADAYDAVAAALKLPKGTDEEKKARTARVQHATRGAADVPLEGIRRCGRALGLLQGFAASCNPNLASDLASAAILLEAAARVMARNVVINTESIRDASTAAGLKAALEAAMAEVESRCGAVMSHVSKA